MEYVFAFTLSVCILNVFALVSIIVGNPISWPSLAFTIFALKPTDFYFMYPSLIYQVYYWSNYVGPA
jgi:hypothetical protein